MDKIGKYKILNEVGHGAMGVVYKALDPSIERVVAIKTMSADLDAVPELRSRFLREARSAGRLSHKNIVTLYDLGEEDGKAYMAMEFLEGEDLNSKISSGKRIPLERKVYLMIEILEGLSHAHQKGIVHRDIKPGNIFVTASGVAKILDFGLARMASSDITNTGAVMGTPNYMSPEQIRSDRTDNRSDIFSAGATFYEFLTSRKPFHASTLPATLFKILQDDPEPPHSVNPSIPSDLSDIILRAMAKKPEDRYQDADAMALDLKSFSRKLEEITRQLQREALDVIECLNRLIADNPDEFNEQNQDETIIQGPLSVVPFEGLQSVVSEGPSTDYEEILKARDQAKAKIDRLTKLLESQKQASTALQEAIACEKAGELDKAVQAAEKILSGLRVHPQAVALISRVRKGIALRAREEEKRQQIATLLEKARQTYERGNLPGSLECIDSLLALDPSHAEATSLRQEVAQCLEDERRRQEQAQKAEELFQGAEIQLSGNNLTAAVEGLEKALELVPEHVGARNLLARTRQQIAERRELEEKRSRAQEALNAGKNALREGDLVRARQEIERAQSIYPEIGGAAELLLETDKLESEKRALEERNRRIEELLKQSRALLGDGKEEEALRRLEALLDFDPQNADALALHKSIVKKREAAARAEKEKQNRIALLLQQIRQTQKGGDFQKAIELAGAALQEYPDHAQTNEILKELQEEQDRGAREELDRRGRELFSAVAAFAEREEFAQAVSALGHADPELRSSASVQKALELYREKARTQEDALRRAEQEKKKRIVSLLGQARKLQKAGKLDEAIELTSSALREDETSSEAHHLLEALRQEQARIQKEQEELERKKSEILTSAEKYAAREDFEQAVLTLANAEPAVAPLVQQSLARYREIVRLRKEEARKAEREKKEKTDSLLAQAKKALGSDKLERAIELARVALAEGADNREVRKTLELAENRLVTRRERERQEREAESLLLQAEELAKNDKLEEAISILQKTEPAIARFDSILQALARYSETLRQREEAHVRAMQIGQHLVAAQEAFKQGNFALCERQLTQLLVLDPNHAEAQDLLARVRRSIQRQHEEELRQVQISEALKDARQSLKRGAIDKARASAERVLALDPENSEAAGLRIQAETRLNQIREQEKKCDKAKRLYANAAALLSEKDVDGAARALAEAITLWPAIPEAAKLKKKIERERKQQLKPKAPPPGAGSHSVFYFKAAGIAILVIAGASLIAYHYRPVSQEAKTHTAPTTAIPSAGLLNGTRDTHPAEGQQSVPSPRQNTPPAIGANRQGAVMQSQDLTAEIRAKAPSAGKREEKAMREANDLPRIAPADPKALRPQGQLKADERRSAEIASGQSKDARSKAEQSQAATLARASFEQALSADADAAKSYQSGDFGPATRRFGEAADLYRRAESEARSKATIEQERIQNALRADADGAHQDFAGSRATAETEGADKSDPGSYREALDLSALAQTQLGKGDYKGARDSFKAASLALQRCIAAFTNEKQTWDSLKNGRDLAAVQAYLKRYPNSPFAEQAARKIEQGEWDAINMKDGAALRAFVQKHPKSGYSQQALAEIAKLDREQRLNADLEAIRQVIGNYAKAEEQMDIKAVQEVWPGIPSKTLNAMLQNLKRAQSMTFKVKLVPLKDPVVSGDTAAIVCRREIQQTYRDGESPAPIRDTVSIKLNRKGNGWVIESIQ